jgi:hypothetical protein
MSQDPKGQGEVARRHFPGLDAAGAAAWSASPLTAGDPRTGANATRQVALVVEV